MAKIHELAKEGKTEELIALLKNQSFFQRLRNIAFWSAFVNEEDLEGNTPLHYAVLQGHTDCVIALIDHGADVNAKYDNGSSPLYEAVVKNYTEIVKALIAHNADVNSREVYGWTSIVHALMGGNTETIKALIQSVDVNAKRDDGSTLLHDAAPYGNTEIIKLLLTKGADVNAKNNNGDTPLVLAAKSGQTEIAIALIAQGADVNTKSNRGPTILYLAAQYQRNETVKHLLSLPNIQVNEIGPHSLLALYPYNPEMTALLQARGVLEHRAANADGTINYNARGQSVHSARTKETVKQTFDALMQAHNAESNPSVIDNAYLNFQNFLKSDDFSKLAKEISDDPNGFGSDAALHRAVKTLNANKRYEVLMRDIAGDLNGIIQRVNHPANSQGVKDDFKKAISLVWLTLQQDEGWETLKGLTTEEERVKERHELMLTFIKGLFDIQHEYFKAGNNLSHAPHAACAPGTVNHALAIFSQQHDKILVTDIEPTPVYDPNGSIKEQLMADDYQRLIEILKASFKEGFKDLEEALSGSSDTIPVLTKEMIDTFFRPNYVNVVIEGRPILIPEHRALLESLLGKVKEQFYSKLTELNVPNDTRNITDAFIALEDALDQIPAQRLAESIIPPAAAPFSPSLDEYSDSDSSMSNSGSNSNLSSNSSTIIFSGNYNRLIPANIEQAYQSCQTTPAYINDMLERLASNPESQRVNLFKEAITAHPEYSNETWFTALSQNQQQTINELIKQGDNKPDAAKPAV